MASSRKGLLMRYYFSLSLSISFIHSIYVFSCCVSYFYAHTKKNIHIDKWRYNWTVEQYSSCFELDCATFKKNILIISFVDFHWSFILWYCVHYICIEIADQIGVCILLKWMAKGTFCFSDQVHMSFPKSIQITAVCPKFERIDSNLNVIFERLE